MAQAHVIAVQGTAHAVLSELVWALHHEGTHLGAVEVWTTSAVVEPLRAFLTSDAWRSLEQVVGRLPSLQPAGEPPGVDQGVRIHVLADGAGRPLDDVRTREDSEQVSAALHDRVRTLRRELRASTVLIGSLAGGRKTMSAALQTAFALQARERDRLVHVLLHPTLEAWLRGESPYAFPERWAEESGVPMAEQVALYDVPFPRLRFLVPRRLVSSLELPWRKVWPEIERYSGAEGRARLVQRGRKWSYTLPGVAKPIPLGWRAGSALATLIEKPDADASDRVGWMQKQNRDFWKPGVTRTKSAEHALANAIHDLRGRLHRGVPGGLERFALDDDDRVLGPVDVTLLQP